MSNPPKRQTSSTFDVALKGSAESGHQVVLSSEDAIQDLFRSETPEMANGLLSHCLKVLKPNEASDDYEGHDERAFMLAVIKEFAPRDGVGRMLAVQMTANNVALIRAGKWFATTDSVEQVKVHYSGYALLARTYAAQLAALSKHPKGGYRPSQCSRST